MQAIFFRLRPTSRSSLRPHYNCRDARNEGNPASSSALTRAANEPGGFLARLERIGSAIHFGATAEPGMASISALGRLAPDFLSGELPDVCSIEKSHPQI
jgi:hypothetical protein